MRMSLDNRTAEKLTPEERRSLLRAFADRMLLKVTAMDDPEDIPGIEKAVRTAAVIERLYSHCDRAERQIRDKTPDPRKGDAERATYEEAAIKAQASLASTLRWGEERRQALGQWWDAARNVTKAASQDQAHPAIPAQKAAETLAPQIAIVTEHPTPSAPKVTYVDYTDCIEQAHTELALKKRSATQSSQVPRPPFRAPP